MAGLTRTAGAAPCDEARPSLGALLTKMPRLDPAWPEAVQDGWMRCFNALRALATSGVGVRDEN